MFTFDCHAHVYDTTQAIDGARYRPAKPAPLEEWLTHLDQNGLKGGVIVQVSFLGNDNSQMLNAMQKLDRNRFAGVAVTPTSASGDELDALCADGVKGIRWNLVRGATIPDPDDKDVKAFLRRLADRDMHLQIHLESPRLAPLLPKVLAAGPNVVIDHFGLPAEANPDVDPFVEFVRHHANLERLFVKASGHYRSKFDVTPHAAALVSALGPDKIVWGSDWPHTQFEGVADFKLVSELRESWRGGGDGIAAQRLYGLQVGDA